MCWLLVSHKMNQLSPGVVLILVLLGLVLLFLFSSCSLKCKSQESYNALDSTCVPNFGCANAMAKTCSLGKFGEIAGNCVMNGYCCPSFSTDQSRMDNLGLTPDMVSSKFAQSMRMGAYGY